MKHHQNTLLFDSSSDSGIPTSCVKECLEQKIKEFEETSTRFVIFIEHYIQTLSLNFNRIARISISMIVEEK